jgi:DNA-binding NtrC family response regulator
MASSIQRGRRGYLLEQEFHERMPQIKTLEEIRKEHIQQVLRSTGGDLEQTCRVLRISLTELRRRMKEYGLSLERGIEKPQF